MLIFLHMPKTAGHSFKQAILEKYGAEQIAFIQNPDDFGDFLSNYRVGNYSCLHGHMPLGAERYLAEPCTHYVVLRDPVDRFISDYYHIYNTPQHPGYVKLRENEISLFDYAQSPCPIHFVCHNAQVRRCASYEFDHKDPNGEFWWTTRKDCDRAMLEEAKFNLEHRIKTFGIFERMDKSFRFFCQMIDTECSVTPKVNVAKFRVAVSDLDAVTVEAIREANHLDIEFYEFAFKLWSACFDSI